MIRVYEITGVTCQGCATKVVEQLTALKQVDQVSVDLANRQVTVAGKAWKISLNQALKETPYRLGREISRSNI